MTLIWAFIYISPECTPEKQFASIESPGWRADIYGVSSIDAGCELARKLVSEDCKLIELCGGFGKDGAAKMVEAIGDAVPVGYVDYFPDGPARIAELIKSVG